MLQSIMKHIYTFLCLFLLSGVAIAVADVTGKAQVTVGGYGIARLDAVIGWSPFEGIYAPHRGLFRDPIVRLRTLAGVGQRRPG